MPMIYEPSSTVIQPSPSVPPPYQSIYNLNPPNPYASVLPLPVDTFNIDMYKQPLAAAPAKPFFAGGTLNDVVPKLIDWRSQSNEWAKQNKATQAANTKLQRSADAAMTATVAIPKGGSLALYGWKGTTGLASGKGAGQGGLQTPFALALQRANAAMKKELGSGFGISSAWRSLQRQQQIYPTKRKGYAARPGTSVHGIGLAADLAGISGKKLAWMKANGAKYGLYAPMLNPKGSVYEPWHWALLPSMWNGQWGR